MEWTGPPPQVFLSILFKFLIEDWWCGWWTTNGLWCDIQSTLAYGVYSISFTIVFHLLHDKVKEGCSCSIRDGFIHLHPRNLTPDKVLGTILGAMYSRWVRSGGVCTCGDCLVFQGTWQCPKLGLQSVADLHAVTCTRNAGGCTYSAWMVNCMIEPCTFCFMASNTLFILLIWLTQN